ncbi:centromere protein S [Clonorchis sinensis]|uniref:Centromere protein S n=1 Tax=Clonorchis sinensis TaxID=79923 RepID=G7YBU8_CLOSI|nr:centromere protein S [Clonorchis sinensis]
MTSRNDGIQLLLQAEKSASEKVNEAKRRKAKRLKEAKIEAQAEIDAERAERERHFKMIEEREHKAELHYKCTKIAEEVAKAQNCTIDLDIVCLATELLFRFYQVLATDLETFAKHAKRTTINMDDVLCFVRRNPQLVQLMSDFHKQQTTGKKPPDVAVPLPTSSGTDSKKSEQPPPKDSETKTAVHSPDSAQSLTEWFMDLE